MLKTKTPDVRSMLLALGVGSFVADLAIPYVWFIPGSVDPDSASIIEINKAMQYGLRKLGYSRVRASGVLDRETAAALDQVSGPRGSWMQKPFVKILDDILNAMRNPDYAAHKINALGGYFEYEGKSPGPVGMSGIFDFMAKPTPLIIEPKLTFGQGVKDKNIIIPIPKKSGITFDAFKNVQRQLNRALATLPGGGKVAEDGIIGNDVLAGLNRVKKTMGVFGLAMPKTTLEVAATPTALAMMLKRYADERKVSPVANAGATTTKASVSEPEPVFPITQTQISTMVGPMATMKKYLPFVLGAGVIAYFAAKKKSKSKGKR